MDDAELHELQCRLVVIHSEIDQCGAAIRDIEQRAADAGGRSQMLTPEENAELREQVKAHSAKLRACGKAGVAIYRRLKEHGFASPELDEWCRTIEGE